MQNLDGRSFNLTVKIYPGGPPHTRGTSAFLGSVAVGTPVAIPQVRAASWAIWPPSRLRRVGFIAFGVGIAEVLEPLQLLLAESEAEVRLVYASRSSHSILYRHRLQRLLASRGWTIEALEDIAEETEEEGEAGHSEPAAAPEEESLLGGRK